jgi:hypothetical protein
MPHWIKVSGTRDRPWDVDEWGPRHRAWRRDQGPISAFPRRPRIVRGDRLVNYAAGSARSFGWGRIYMVEEVVSDEPEPGGHPRWPWVVKVEPVVWVELLSYAPTIEDIGVRARSLSQQSHIRLTDEQGELAEALIREAALELTESGRRHAT